MNKKEVVAMLLAGGKGSRLVDLTKDVAKPAIHYGGKYRIIDFSLSNCSNSGIDTVGVLTQYEPLVLNSYIGNGTAWDLDVMNGGVTVLQPFSTGGNIKWYSGTASAVALNVKFIDIYDPDFVLILSGDHIYKMDYSQMLDFHVEMNADFTISAIEVPWEETSRFGILNTFENHLIYEFEEKPNEARSNMASMGIYIINWKVLRSLLLEDLRDETSLHDFGKDIIPKALSKGYRLFAYPFKGYWKDVGTIMSLWEANMDLLDPNCELELYDRTWPIYSVSQYMPPHFIDMNAELDDVLINEGCRVYGKVSRSLLSYGVEVRENTTITNSVIMPNVSIEEDCVLDYCIVQEGLTIPKGTVIKGSRTGIILVSKPYLEHKAGVVNE